MAGRGDPYPHVTEMAEFAFIWRGVPDVGSDLAGVVGRDLDRGVGRDCSAGDSKIRFLETSTRTDSNGIAHVWA